MPNTSKHQHLAVTISDHVSHLIGLTVSSMVVSTAKNTVANNLTVYKTNATGAAIATVQLQSYSYDGVIHVDSYISDI